MKMIRNGLGGEEGSASRTISVTADIPTRFAPILAAVGLLLVVGPATAEGPPTGTPSAPLPGGASILAWTPDQQVIGYRTMEKITPVKVVRRGDAALELTRAAFEIAPRWTWKGQDMDVDRYMAAMRTSGVIVLKNRKIVLEKYGLGRTASDRWTSFSVAKSLTSILIGAAIKDGYIKSLDAPVTDYIHELKGSAYEGVSIRNLLTMTSGVKWNENYADPQSDVAQAGQSVVDEGVNPIVSYMRRLPRLNAPGSKFVYKTGETDLAGVLVSNAVGKSLSDYLSEKLWRPYGMEQDAYWALDAAGHERGGCCISMTLRDYARVGQFMADNGVAGGVHVLPDGWVKDATSAHDVFPPGDEAEVGYGYFWWIYRDAFAAEGIFGQEIFVFPKDQVVIAINSAWLQADRSSDWQAQAEFAKALRDAAVAAGR